MQRSRPEEVRRQWEEHRPPVTYVAQGRWGRGLRCSGGEEKTEALNTEWQ